MFDTERVPVRFADLSPRQMEKDDKEIGLLELQLEINPFTAAMAGELHDFVKRTLFTASATEVTSLLGGATFRLGLLPQEIAVRAAPDQVKASFVILEAKIGPFKAKRSKKSSAWTASFIATCAPQTKDQLAQLMDCYLKTRYLTFADATPDLFSEIGKEEKRARRAAAGGESAATH